MNWKTLIVILLLLPVYWEEVLPASAVEYTQHMAEMGEHCFDHCPHPSSLIESPRETAATGIPPDEVRPFQQLIALLPHPHAARDRPPPLLWSTSHSLRAPPTLILA